MINSDSLLKESKYWRDNLSGELSRSSIPYDFTIKKTEISKKIEEFELSQEASDYLLKLSNNSDYRLFIALLSAINLLVYKYTGNTDIIIGSPVLKQEKEVEYINTILAIRNKIKEEMTFRDLLLNVKQIFFDAVENQNYPINTLMYDLGLPFSNNDFSLFDITVLLEGLHDTQFKTSIYQSIIITFINTDNRISGNIEYNASLYTSLTIKRIINHIGYIFDIFKSSVEKPLNKINIISDNERYKILEEFNNTQTKFKKCSITETFIKQVNNYGDKVAVVSKNNFITYRELNRRSDTLAKVLYSKGVRENEIVGFMIDRSIEMITTMLAIIKLEAIYLPFSGDQPSERIKYMLEDCNVSFIVTQNLLNEYSIKDNIEITDINNLPKIDNKHFIANLEEKETRNSYIIYTSGSTGRPKGVLVSEKGVINMVNSHKTIFGENSNFYHSQTSNQSFDAMAFEIWPCLLNGATLILIDENIRINARMVQNWLIKHAINVSYQPTIVAEQLIKLDWRSLNTQLKMLFTAGERLTSHINKKTPFDFYNLYGPTENTVWTTFSQVTETAYTEYPVIGKPICNNNIFILDIHGEIQPMGIVGEIYISGNSLSLGYLNNPEMTSDFFIPSPFNKNEVLYRTGDFARWLPTGDIDFWGRIDNQVKIRGYRIDLKEIEYHIRQYDNIKDVVIIVKENKVSEKKLIAYVTACEKVDSLKIKSFLSSKIPKYMLPAFIIELDEMPINNSGKIDKRQLYSREDNLFLSEKYIAPQNNTQKILSRIWSELLEIEKIGINHSFFDLGGDSMNSIKLINMINKELNSNLKVVDLYENPSIDELSLIIEGKKSDNYENLYDEAIEEVEKLKNKFIIQ